MPSPSKYRLGIRRILQDNTEITPFQQRVYLLCAQIPPGKVSTYGDIAKTLQTSPRAVGQALRNNPLAPSVPCHRVVHTSMYVGGYFGNSDRMSPQVARKINLLQGEGVEIDENGCIGVKHLFAATSIKQLPSDYWSSVTSSGSSNAHAQMFGHVQG